MEITVLRPWAFWFLIPAVLFCILRFREVKAWFGVIDAHLLSSLLMRFSVRLRGMFSFLAVFLVCFCAVFALAGVSFRSREAPLYTPKSPVVIVLDLSLSMRVNDVAPNRFSRAVFKTYDLLKALDGIPAGLVVFTNEPYQVVPATTDRGVIEAVLPLLNFSLMPSQGTRIDRALDEALTMIEASGAVSGDVFLMTDGGEEAIGLQDKSLDSAARLAENGSRLFVLGIGTTKGGALLKKENDPFLDRLGNPVHHRLKEAFLKKLAVAGNGAYASVSADGSDMAFLLNAYRRLFLDSEKADLTDRDKKADEGYWFLIPPLLAFPFLFLKGRFLAVLLVISVAFPARAASLSDWFLNPAARAAADYARGDKEAAVKAALASDDFTLLYNTGTRLIYDRDYGQAVELLEKAVLKRPENEDAQINLEIAKRLSENPSSQSSQNGFGEGPQGDGGSEGNSDKNNLNQNNNNSSDQSENKEKNNQNKEEDNSWESPPSGDDGNPEKGDDPQGGSGGKSAPSDKSGGQDEQNGQPSGDSGKGGRKNQKDGQSQKSPGEGNEQPQKSPESPDSREQEIPSGGFGGTGNTLANTPENQSGDITRVSDDPMALLRHKILFLHQEKRYEGEPEEGAEW